VNSDAKQTPYKLDYAKNVLHFLRCIWYTYKVFWNVDLLPCPKNAALPNDWIKKERKIENAMATGCRGRFEHITRKELES
jgi:hypothetical protein